jgi:hypothetical protein
MLAMCGGKRSPNPLRQLDPAVPHRPHDPFDRSNPRNIIASRSPHRAGIVPDFAQLCLPSDIEGLGKSRPESVKRRLYPQRAIVFGL